MKLLKFNLNASGVATKSDIQAFETEFKLQLPQAFTEFCLQHNGGIPSSENNFYPVPVNFFAFHEEYGPSSQGTPGIISDVLFGLTKDPSACDIRDEFRSLREELSLKLFPISHDLFGNQVVLREDNLNGLVFWRDHELWEAPEVPALFPIAENLEAFYNSLTSDPYSDERENQ